MLILASTSPRRAELLRNAGFDFRVVPPAAAEQLRSGEPPVEYVKRLAGEKGRSVRPQFPQDVVIAADTTVVVAEEILEKPRNSDDASRMLRLLRGRAHEVITGIYVACGESERLEHETTRVEMAAITDEEIDAYVASKEPMDKAGAYAIQGIASRWVSRIEGCYFNVVGLPVPRLYRILRDLRAV
jgi:septum formation protein